MQKSCKKLGGAGGLLFAWAFIRRGLGVPDQADGNPEEIDEILFDVTEELADAPASDQNAEE